MYQTEWWTLYRAAILETNPDQIGKRVSASQNAIEARLLTGQVSHQENAAIYDARRTLETLAGRRTG
jgi:hypothetical protein